MSEHFNYDLMRIPWMFVFHRSCLHPRGYSRLLRGKWSFYNPASLIKLPYSYKGHLHCRSKNAPSRDDLLSGLLDSQDFSPYSVSDWKKAYQTTVLRRTAENFVITKRLYEAGLGPEPMGLVSVEKCLIYGLPGIHPNYGMRVQDVNKLKKKAEASESDVLAAGVMPDTTKSCMRQQVNGYLLDLNSVTGVQAIDAEDEIETIVSWLKTSTGK